MKGFLRVFAIFYAIGTYLTDLRFVQFPSIFLSCNFHQPLRCLNVNFLVLYKNKIIQQELPYDDGRKIKFCIKQLSRYQEAGATTFIIHFYCYIRFQLSLRIRRKIETTNILTVALFFSIDSLISFELYLHSFFVPRQRSLRLTCTLCIYLD